MDIFEINYDDLAQKVKETLFDEDENFPLSCSLQEILADDESHNCLACNLADYTWGLYNTLKGYALLGKQASGDDWLLEYHVVFSMFHWLSVMVEALKEIEKVIGIKLIERNDEFKTCTRIIKWTNFFKHPKTMVFVHHPTFTYNNIPEDAETVINEQFVFRFYSNKNSNDELKSLLANKGNGKVFVKLPDLFDLLEGFSKELKEIIDLVNCGPYRRMLADKSTLENFYAPDSD